MEGSSDQLEEARSLLHKRTGCTEPSFNVAVIGASGSGKSSFINSVFASFSGEYRERVAVGSFGDTGRQVTSRIARLPKEKYMECSDNQKYSYPTMYDMAGFENDADGLAMNILKLVFDGRLPEDEKLITAQEEYNKNGSEGLLRRYPPEEKSPSKIDRIIFVASAKPVHESESRGDCYPVNDSFSLKPVLPVSLINGVIKVARESNRDIPIYGVLTHKDTIDVTSENYKRFEKEFRECLGIPKTRFLLCTNYCDDYDENKQKNWTYQTYPELDMPITQFMTTVLDRALEVVEDRQTRTQRNSFLSYLLHGIIIGIIMFFLLSPPLSGENLYEMCEMYKGQTVFEHKYLTQICEMSKQLTERPIFSIICIPVLFEGIPFALNYAARRFPQLEKTLLTINTALD